MAGSPVSRLTPPESKDTMALEPAFIFAWPAAWPEAKLEVSPDEVPPAFVPPRVFSGVEATAMRTAQSRAPSPCATMGAGMSSGRRRATAPLARRRTSGPSLCGTKPARRPSTSSAAARPSDMNKRVVRRFMGIPVGNGTAGGLPPSDGYKADLTAHRMAGRCRNSDSRESSMALLAIPLPNLHKPPTNHFTKSVL